MVLVLAIIGALLSVILLYYQPRKYKSAVYLGLFFHGISLYGLFHYILLYSKSVTLVSYSLAAIPLFGSFTYLIGPMLYLYVRSVIADQTVLKKSDLWHLLPMVVFFIAALPDLFVHWSVKAEAATAIVNDATAIGFYKPTLLSQIFSYPFMFISRPVLILGYTCWSTIIFIRYYMRRKQKNVLSGQQFMIKWLSILLASMLILLICQTLLIIDFTIKGSYLFNTLTILKMLSLLSIIVLIVSPFFFPEVLYGLPRVPGHSITSKSSGSETQKNLPEKSKPETRFEENYFIHIREKAEACMKDFQPYLQPDFNLAQLSVLMHVPVHHLAYYFREVKKQTFSDLRNEWRVEHAKKLITDGKSNNLTLEAIGILSGFSSRNTFLVAFKKVEGISPQTYLTRIKK